MSYGGAGGETATHHGTTGACHPLSLWRVCLTLLPHFAASQDISFNQVGNVSVPASIRLIAVVVSMHDVCFDSSLCMAGGRSSCTQACPCSAQKPVLPSFHLCHVFFLEQKGGITALRFLDKVNSKMAKHLFKCSIILVGAQAALDAVVYCNCNSYVCRQRLGSLCKASAISRSSTPAQVPRLVRAVCVRSALCTLTCFNPARLRWLCGSGQGVVLL